MIKEGLYCTFTLSVTYLSLCFDDSKVHLHLAFLNLRLSLCWVSVDRGTLQPVLCTICTWTKFSSNTHTHNHTHSTHIHTHDKHTPTHASPWTCSENLVMKAAIIPVRTPIQKLATTVTKNWTIPITIWQQMNN